MRRKIWRMSEDQFDEKAPDLMFDVSSVDVVTYEKEPFEGFFVVKSTNGVPVRGMVYSSNPYVICQTPEFDGIEFKIHYRITSDGFLAGDSLSGIFTLVYNQGEKTLPYHISFTSKLPEWGNFRLERLEQFADFARDHWNEAMHLFFTPGFEQFMMKQEERLWLLYRGYRGTVPSSRNLEEFLVTAGLKKGVTFDVDETPLHFYDLRENQKETITITKSTWGYISIDVHSDGDFVTVEKEQVTSDYFVGSTMQLNLYVHQNFMHSGKNYARITFDSPGMHKEILLTATLASEHIMRDDFRRVKKQAVLNLSRLYENYRLRRITTAEWSDGTVEILDHLMSMSTEDTTWMRLLKTQALVVNKRRQESLELISELKKDIEDKKSVQWAYLLYLCTLIESEKTYVDRITHEIEVIFREHPEDSRIFWFLLFLREEYVENPQQKLAAIREWVLAGTDSPFLYVEAYELYGMDPLLLREFDDFSLRILTWALRHQALHGNLAMQITSMLSHEGAFRPGVFYVVTKTYEMYPEPELFTGILNYLLKNHMMGEKYLPWYRQAIEKEEKLAGLYEAYVASLPLDSIEQLPVLVTMYFSYQNTLDYEKKAFVYANVITYKHKEPHLYQDYIRSIEAFALEQMRLLRMDDNLAIIYQDVLDAGIIDSDVADAVGRLLAPHKIVCLSPGIRRVIIYQDKLKNPMTIPVINHAAYAPILSEKYQVFLEDESGSLLTDEHLYYVEPLINLNRSYSKLKRLARNRLPYFLYDLNHMDSAMDLPKDGVELVQGFLSSETVSHTYKVKKYPMMIAYLKDHSREDIFEDYLMGEHSYQGMDSDTIAYLTDLMIIGDRYEEAYALLKRSNGMLVTGKSLLRLCNHRIMETESAPDDFLVALCAYLMEEFLSSDETVTYLNRFYIGPTEKMLHLWRHADALQLPVGPLEERMITQMLYAENLPKDHDQVFESYLSHHPNKMMVEAYLTYWAHKDLKGGGVIPEAVYTHLMHRYRDDEHLNESCRISLLKHLCLKMHLENYEYQVLDHLLGDCIRRNIYFDFYGKMQNSLIIKYHLYDKVFVTYRGEPRQRILISFSKNEEPYARQEMIEMYEGIYVRQFVMFFGETLHYEILSGEDETKVLMKGESGFESVIGANSESRFGLLNRMQSETIYFDEKKLLSDMKEYNRLEKTSDMLFELV